MDGTIGLDFEYQFFVVSLLLYTKVFNTVLYVLDRGINGVHKDSPQGSICLFVLLSRYISTTFLNCYLEIQVHLRIHITKNQFWVKYLEPRNEFLEIASLQLLASGNGNSNGFVVYLVNLSLETNLL